MIVSELFLYDGESGLFKQILLHSKVMAGRYFVATSGFDLSNLDPVQKYPCVLCTPPKSSPVAPAYIQETFSFDLYFLVRSGQTGQNQIKSPDKSTLTSNHPVWYDWKDMNECAVAFLRQLKEVTKKRMVGEIPLRALAGLDPSATPSVLRISNAGSDVISGVKLSFIMLLNQGCDSDDYTGVTPDQIAVPSLNPHPLHKH